MASQEVINEGETEFWMVATVPFGRQPTSLLAGLHVSRAPILVSMVNGAWEWENFWFDEILKMNSWNENWEKKIMSLKFEGFVLMRFCEG